MLVGTRDDRLFPTGNWAFGAVARPDEDVITVFLPTAQNMDNLRNVRSNGKVAFLIGHDEGHETYQIKGEYIDDRPCTDEDRAIQEVYRKKFISKFKPEVGELMDRLVQSHPYAESTALSFRATAIFDQTPGPGAGQRIDF
jgi:hypothetical protein